ncbi:MAG: 4Fe-4S dicluster domain-containing protein [Sedimentisphaerales bacterium]|nr:4Fe-4S dicluster domain-containing protein [Sedimentisphaerales bacterium]
MMDKTIVVNVKKCLACKSCEIACAVEHSKSKTLNRAIVESPLPQKRVRVESAGAGGIPIQCRHCEKPLCAEVCPTGAISRIEEQGPVVVEQHLCVGCKLCMVVCPFGVLELSSEGRAVVKCDMCAERLKKGEQPACVEACPTKAVKLISLKKETKSRRINASDAVVTKTSESSCTEV